MADVVELFYTPHQPDLLRSRVDIAKRRFVLESDDG